MTRALSFAILRTRADESDPPAIPEAVGLREGKSYGLEVKWLRRMLPLSCPSAAKPPSSLRDHLVREEIAHAVVPVHDALSSLNIFLCDTMFVHDAGCGAAFTILRRYGMCGQAIQLKE
jgi:hypothetical protein